MRGAQITAPNGSVEIVEGEIPEPNGGQVVSEWKLACLSSGLRMSGSKRMDLRQLD